MAPRHVVVVLNPNAPGAASVLDALHQIANDDPSRYTLLLLTSPDISELVAAALDRHGKGGCCFVAGGGDGTLAAVASIMGKIPTMEEYLQYAEDINTMADDVYRYLNFNEMESYTSAANKAFPVKVA